uniref:Uncharacterized protein n=1 Tax=Anguilla anguilla TaxID=7936 RepID=A0A0E9WNZ6_ANGAN
MMHCVHRTCVILNKVYPSQFVDLCCKCKTGKGTRGHLLFCFGIVFPNFVFGLCEVTFCLFHHQCDKLDE